MPRARQSRAGRQAAVSAVDLPIPDKLYFRIGEVSRLTQTKAYVLRFWETEFPTLRPVKSRSGHRLYRRQDVETIFEIRRLLYHEGFTIEGARKQLDAAARKLRQPQQHVHATLDGTQLKAIRRELESILTLLSRR